MTSRRAVIGLGSNLGSREALLSAGCALLDAEPEVEVMARSPLYLTAPVGPPQPDFLNAAARVRTTLPPHGLLEALLRVEARLGRVREVRWGPRTLDLDLLHMEGAAVSTPELEVPHPRLSERSFALAPLLDVAPELTSTYGPALTRLGERPRPRAWSRAERLEDGVLARAVDDADALALAASAWLGSPTAITGVTWREASSPSAFVSDVAALGPGSIVIVEWASSVIRGAVLHGPTTSLREPPEAVVLEEGHTVSIFGR